MPNDNVHEFPPKHKAKQGIDHLPGQLELMEHASEGAPKPFEALPENATILPVTTSHKQPVNRILQAAFDEGLESVTIIGYTKAGKEYFASSEADAAEVTWLLERTKFKLLQGFEEFTTETPTPEKA